MTRQYDLFEVLQDGSKMWRTSICGREAALQKLQELGKKSENRIVAIHLETRETIGVADSVRPRMNVEEKPN